MCQNSPRPRPNSKVHPRTGTVHTVKSDTNQVSAANQGVICRHVAGDRVTRAAGGPEGRVLSKNARLS